MKRVLFSLVLVLSGARSAWADTQAGLQAVVGAVVAKGVTGSALCVDDPALGHFAVAAGVADRSTGRALQPTDRFRIASVSKTFTAAAVLMLRDEGRLDIDATLGTYLPEYDIPNAGIITLRMLLTHTSGLPDHNNDSQEFGLMTAAHPEVTITPSQVFDLVRRLPVHFAPGAAWRYCDTGYYILRLVVEKRNAQGWTFSQFIQNRLLTPWALANTFVPGPENDYLYHIPGVYVHGYWDYVPGNAPLDVTDTNQSWDVGCGGMVSTVEDLARWARLLYSGQVLSARSSADMKTITMQSRAYGICYGMAAEYETTVGFGHGGITYGYLTEMHYDSVHQTASATLVNLQSPETTNIITKPLLIAAKRALGYPEQADPGYARLAAGSGRGLAGTGEETLTLGFAFGGTESKSMIVRAAGPLLRSFGVASALADPRVQVSAGSASIATNDNWDGSASTTSAFTQVGAYLFPTGGKDAAIVKTLAPGGYCATVASSDGSSGVALVEVFDAHALASAPSRMTGISVRGRAGAGEDVLIAGFVVAGNAPMRVLIRGVGPALANYGIVNPVADPQITLHSGQGIVAQNDNWDGSVSTAALIAQTGLSTLPAGSKDAAIVATLNPGAYTVLLRSATAAVGGIALIEVYDAQPQPDYAATRQLVGDYVRRRMQETGVVGLSVALVESDGVILQEGFGFSDPAKAIPVTADTQFSIGSVTKTMAAMSIMQLVTEGKLDLDAPLSAALPSFTVQQRFPSAPITARSILAHHSGLPGDLLNGSMTTVPNDRWCDSLLASLELEYAERPVGEMMAYSNSAYTLLQNVIENASGLSLVDYGRQLVFGPTGMEASTFGNDAPAWTSGFIAGQAMPTEYVNVGTAGSVKSSATDMARYLRLLIHEGLGDHGRVLAPSVFRQMLVRQYPDDAFDGYGNSIWGLGFQMGTSALDYAGSNFGHSGATQVFRSQLTVLKDQGLGVFVVSNTTSPSDFPEVVSREILRIALQQLRGLIPPAPLESTSATIVSKTQAELEIYAGLYAPGFGGYDKIVATDGGLEWTRAAGTATPTTARLLPCADGRFVPASGGPFQFEFKTIANRSVMIMHATNDGWVDRSICSEKLSLSPLSPAWQQRVGDYVWINLAANSYAPLILGTEGAERVRLEVRDGLLLFGGEVVVPTSDMLAFTAGIGSSLGRGRGDALQADVSDGIGTLWFRGQAARLASLPLSGYTYPDPADFSALTWTAAFEAAHAKFSREYAFGDWKAVDWLDLYNRFMPRIVHAQAAGYEKA
ncbi:MAG: serine hydrolase domain-containing protein, partial [Opitutaceae bacterium]